MALFKTKVELATGVLQRLRVYTSNETPSADDSAYVEDEYDSILAMYDDKELIYWPNTDRSTAEIPIAVYQPFVDILCGTVAGTFGKAEPTVADERGQQIPVSTRGWRNLKKHISRRPSGLPTPAVYF